MKTLPRILLAACALAPVARAGDDCRIAGKVELLPALPADLQILKLGAGRFENRIDLRLVPHAPDDEEFARLIRFGEHAGVKLGEPFLEEVPCEMTLIVRCEMIMDSQAGEAGFGFFWTPMKIALQPGVINYLGTLRLHRDEFFEIVKLEVVDEPDSVRALAAKAAPKLALRKALAVPLELPRLEPVRVF